MKRFFGFCAVVLLAAATLAQAKEWNFRSVTVELGGTKIWTPSVFVVHKGDKVKFHLVTTVPAPNNVHGFALDDFKIAEVVDEKGKDIEFVAKKEGVFPIRCHLHPAHIGGQLVVLK